MMVIQYKKMKGFGLIMKKITALLLILILLGCSRNRMIRNSVFTEKGITYNVTDRKPAKGTLKKDNESYTYKDGRLRRYIKLDSAGKVVEEKNYDSCGLLQGNFKDEEGYMEYRHGVLEGMRKQGAVVESYKDGVLHGGQEIGGERVIYSSGSRYIEGFRTPKRYRRVVFEEVKGKRYSGEVYLKVESEGASEESTVTLEVRGYKRGVLKYLKHYDNKGLKVDEYHFYEVEEDRFSNVFSFNKGELISADSYNEKGELDGMVFRYSSPEVFSIINYTEGLLHGYTKIQNKRSNEVIREGWYRVGAFCGRDSEKYYYNGLEIKRAPEEDVKPLTFEKESSKKKGNTFIRRSEGKESVVEGMLDGELYTTYFFEGSELKRVRLRIDDVSFVDNFYTRGIVTDVNLNMGWYD